ncbi:HAMP domain-containing sensor histidine kinase [uncultured Lentibacter sp.]|jgi:signal transduction histidine kinase|uniref:sensor histidine kinase n=1 Tax=uncultured Lentibacter sp. TaxID=1659309 RepID=UPI00263933B6|nr:HAMP domain-containing sensor histidine kinase [uncultured Lentibacter sp.]
MINTLSGRFLVLTVIFVMLAEILIFVPSIARFREDYLLSRLERGQIASLALLADDMIGPELEAELLRNAEVFNVVLRRNEARQLILSSPMPRPIYQTYDLRDAPALVLIRDAMFRLFDSEDRIIRVIGNPVREAGLLIEISLDTRNLRLAMIDYGLRILALSAVISVFTAVLLFWAVRMLLVRPIKRVVGDIQAYAADPEDANNIINPSARVAELREAEQALQSLETQLTGALKQKERLAQLGAAVAKISHDLRNILTTAQLFTDRIELSEDPAVQRMAPKLVGSIRRAVNLCETTLAFGKAEEPAPQLDSLRFDQLVADVFEAEQLAGATQAISFVSDVPEGFALRADSEQLYRVISNLVRNAREALEGRHTQAEVRVNAIRTADAVTLTVTDTGPGLPDKARKHLFEAFHGGARKGGSGLGLAIAAELIRGHGGELTLHSSDANGTCFRIYLPQ